MEEGAVKGSEEGQEDRNLRFDEILRECPSKP